MYSDPPFSYTNIYELQRLRPVTDNWEYLTSGSIEYCKEKLENLRIHGTMIPVVLEVEY